MLSALRQQLTAIVDPPRPDVGGLSTGIATLDRALSDGGIPYGRLTEIVGQRGSGMTTLARALAASAIHAGRWVAYVDAARTLSPRDWAPLAVGGGLWVIRPPNAERGAWCTDVLLRSGAFGLVVLDGAPPLTRQVAVRLTHLARESNAAFVLVGETQGTLVGSAVRLRVKRATGDGRRERRRTLSPLPSLVSRLSFLVTVEKGGLHQSVEVGCAIDVACRLCAHPEVPDRRGVAPRNRLGQTRAEIEGRGPRTEDRGSTPALPRKRRFGEPAIARHEFLLGSTKQTRGRRRSLGRATARAR